MSKKTDQTLEKCNELIDRLQELKKALDSVNASSNRKPMNALGTGWSMDTGTGAFHHSAHGIINTSKHKDGYFEIKHGGRAVGRANDMNEAGAKIKNYVRTLKPGDTGMHNLDPMKVAKDEDMNKSNYGPKRGDQYIQSDNAKRKSNNVGDVVEGAGTNVNVKAYSSKPGQLSAKQQAAQEAKKAKQLNGKVRQYTPEQIAAINEARKLQKSTENGPWIAHAAIPSADEEVEKINVTNKPEVAENLIANQLANMMLGKSMLGTPPPKQPTDQEMFGHLVVSEEVAKNADKQWNGAINNWLVEAQKPISSRFNSEEEELAYWASIKVADRDDGKSGY